MKGLQLQTEEDHYGVCDQTSAECRERKCVQTDKRTTSTTSAVSKMCLVDLTAASARPFDCVQYGEDVMWLNWYLLANVLNWSEVN